MKTRKSVLALIIAIGICLSILGSLPFFDNYRGDSFWEINSFALVFFLAVILASIVLVMRHESLLVVICVCAIVIGFLILIVCGTQAVYRIEGVYFPWDL